MTYKILCIDGGGIRGVFALEILKMLHEDVGKHCLDQIDCFSGTSTGALIISGLLKGYSPTELIYFYSLFGRKIFPERRKAVRGEAKYNQRFLHTILSTTFSHKTTLADLEKHVIIPACYLHHEEEKKWGVQVYDNYDREKAKQWSLIDVALRTSAAPIYFPSYQNYIDGGIYALNPSLLALSRVLDKTGGAKNLEEIQLLSIGTGINPISIGKEINWGVDQWMSSYESVMDHPLFSLITDIGATIPDYPLKQLLHDRYLRVNATLSSPVEIDDASKVHVLKEAARDLKETALWQEVLCFFKKR